MLDGPLWMRLCGPPVGLRQALGHDGWVQLIDVRRVRESRGGALQASHEINDGSQKNGGDCGLWTAGGGAQRYVQKLFPQEMPSLALPQL